MGTKDEQIKGGVRLLFVERSLYQPPSYDIGKPTYLAIAEQFNLPEEAVHALSNLCGVSTYSLDVDEINETPQSLRMVIKASQKFQVGNYGLAFSHDFATGISCGILHGTGVTTYGKDYDLWEKPPVLEIFEHIKNTHHLWSQPMFLATILLQHHFLRTDYFCTIILANKFTDLQFQMGTSRAGRLNGVPAPNLAAQMSVPQAKVSLRAMTVAMSSLMFDINWFCSVSDWECTCLKQIAEVHAEVEGFIGRSRAFRLMREKIQYLLASAESIKLHNNRMREAGQTDMSIVSLCSSLPSEFQKDNAILNTNSFTVLSPKSTTD